jgi:AraC family transcriptional regulator, melibiose operon regulatory protein
LNKGEVLIIPSDTIHSSNSFNRPFFFNAIVFDSDLLASSLADKCRSSYIDPVKNHKIDYRLHIKGRIDWEINIIEKIGTLIDYYNKKPIGYELGIKGLLCDIFFGLISNNTAAKEENLEKNLEFDRLKNTITFIHNNYMEKITVDELAEQSFMSVYYFCRFFKKVIGMTPFDYINHYRVLTAARLLRETKNPISTIGYDVGFNDSSYFSKIFQKYINCTPSEYRNT